MTHRITVIGAGLAGVEATWQLAQRQIPVRLIEMRPARMTPAHHTDLFAELVCSNSLRADTLRHAAGLLKREMRSLSSITMQAADACCVPAGSALAVERDKFSHYITEKLIKHQLVQIDRTEAVDIPDGITIIATGPLTSDAFARSIGQFLGTEYLHFFDALSPIVYADSLNEDRLFWQSRYDPQGRDYLNCPMTKEHYDRFIDELVNADRHKLHEFERDPKLFEGCLPIEEMARRGRNTLKFGPLRPVGFTMPDGYAQPYAVVQLRRENAAGSLLNLVGFQTNLKHDEQKRVFSLIPGLETARFARFGAMHRNTFINAPLSLLPTLQAQTRSDLLFAGQITGVEGYVESAATGIIAGINAYRLCTDQDPITFPPQTAHGALCHYITAADPAKFQPMNINFGLFADIHKFGSRDQRVKFIVDRALTELDQLQQEIDPYRGED